MKNKKGFTLIELLVVIAIIGLLSTLAIVSLNTARQKSRDSKRAADLRTMQSATELYVNDTGGAPAVATWALLETALASYLVGGQLPEPPSQNGCGFAAADVDSVTDCYVYCNDRLGAAPTGNYLLKASFETKAAISGDLDGTDTSYAEAGECLFSNAVVQTGIPAIDCADDTADVPAYFCLGTL